MTRWIARLLSIARIGVGFMILEHGLQTAFGLLGGRADWNFAKLHAWAGPIEAIGGSLLILGLCTRFTGFILSGEMAVAYFQSPLRWASPTAVFVPITNGGEEAAINCFVFLWLMTAGGGAWSLDALVARRRTSSRMTTKEVVTLLEPQARALMRMVAAYLIFLHGLREVFGLMAARGRGPGSFMALDQLGQVGGLLLLAGSALIFAGFLARPASLVLAIQCGVAYVYASVLRGPLPVRNGSNETLIYAFVFAFLVAAGAGAWSFDGLRDRAGVPKSEMAGQSA